jgi:SAM-dependent methyltransferase
MKKRPQGSKSSPRKTRQPAHSTKAPRKNGGKAASRSRRNALFSFVESWLPLTSLQQELFDFLQLPDEESFNAAQRLFQANLEAESRRLMGDVYETYSRLSREVRHATGRQGNRIERQINAIAFKYDLSLTIPPETGLRTRSSLALLAQYVRGLRHEVNVVDLGCGNGQLGLGLLQCCPNVRSLFAIDNEIEAIRAFARCLQRIPARTRARLKDRLVFQQGDYLKRNQIEPMLSLAKGAPTLLLSAYPMQTSRELLQYLERYLSPTVTSVQLYPGEDAWPLSGADLIEMEYQKLLEAEPNFVMLHQESDSYMPMRHLVLTVLGRAGKSAPG